MRVIYNILLLVFLACLRGISGVGYTLHKHNRQSHKNNKLLKGVFLNTWAVVVHGDERMAQKVASENGFVNKGKHRTEAGYEGHDMNVLPVWEKGLSGKGIVVSILDDGIEYTHDELKDNYDPKASYDYNSNDTDPMPRYTWRNDNRHGTRCAGEVAAAANNSKCIVGVAFGASVGGIRMLDGEITDIVEARSLRHARDHIDIYSSSWGPEDDGTMVDGPGPLAKQALEEGAKWGRQGKGSIFVWASGNGGLNRDHCNCDGYTNSIYTISVSAATSAGGKPWYLESCASTLVSAYSSGSLKSDRDIITADLGNGCTDTHTGTSVSPPLIGGFIALALEANPNLTWRDVQHLLVQTSSLDKLTGDDFHLNGAKKRYSHHFGFGIVNGAKLVSLAERWPTISEQRKCHHWKQMPGFPHNRFNRSSPLIVEINSTACKGAPHHVKYIEHIQVVATFYHHRRGESEILIVSPMQTSSWVLRKRVRDKHGGDFNSWPFLSTHFWGEDPSGTWKIFFFSKESDEYGQGFLRGLTLIVYGTLHKPGKRINGDTVTSPHKCHAECKMGCTGPGNNQCTKCQHYSYYDLKTKEMICLATCPANKYSDRHQMTCMECQSSCRTCSNRNISHCTSCFPSAALSNGACLQKCPKKMYKAVAGDGMFVCSNCAERCAACFGSSDNCTVCDHGSILKQGSCYAKCANNEWLNGATCQLCHPSCKTCDGEGDTKCTTCTKKQLNDAEDRYLYKGSQCIKECPLGTFHEDTIKQNCLDCPQNCLSCSNHGMKCDACDVKFYRLSSGDGKCVKHCPSGYYTNEINRLCEPCGLGCASCVPRNPSACTSCLPGFYLKDGECVSASECNTYYFVNKTSGKCTNCPPSCSICNSADDCTSCFFNYFLTPSNNCVSLCPNGTFPQDGRERCELCHKDCAACDGPFSRDCTVCHAGKVLYDGKCVKDMPEGYFIDRVDNTATCRRCHHTCASCVGPGPQNCSTCIGTLDKRMNRCINPCPDQYLSENSCKSCHPSCKSCVGYTAQQCLECYNNESLNVDTLTCNKACHRKFYKDSKTFICQSCHKSCATCTGPQANQCVTCPDKLYFHNGTCILQCPSGWYKTFGRECAPCSKRCRKCLYNYDLCTHCRDDFVWRDFKCHKECGVKMFHDSSNRCYPCDHSCQTCVGTAPDTCTSCEEGKTLYKGMCVQGCLPGFYMHAGTCTACGENCLSCSGEENGKSVCIVCVNYTVLSPNGRCSESCPTSTYQSAFDNRCIKCPGVGCEKCVNSLECSTCMPLYQLSNGLCKSTCGMGRYPDTSTRQCGECHPFCLSCDGPAKNDCKRCSDKAVTLIDKKKKRKCVKSCPPGFYSISKLCLPCAKPCKTCLNENSCTSCQHPLVLYKDKCVNNCPHGSFNDGRQKCSRCSDMFDNCAECNDTNCTTCATGTYHLDGTCVDHCSSLHTQNSSSCVLCSTLFGNCMQCNQSMCLNCVAGFHVENGICISTCSSNHCFFNNTCSACGNHSEVTRNATETSTSIESTSVPMTVKERHFQVNRSLPTDNVTGSVISIETVEKVSRARRSVERDSPPESRHSSKPSKISLACVAFVVLFVLAALLGKSKRWYLRRRILVMSLKDTSSSVWTQRKTSQLSKCNSS